MGAHMKKIVLVAAWVAAICAATSASATVITFSALAGNNGDAFTTYTESGFTVAKLSGTPQVAKQFGNPTPDIFFDPGQSTLSLTGGLFNFASADVAANGGQTTFAIFGYLNNVLLY